MVDECSPLSARRLDQRRQAFRCARPSAVLRGGRGHTRAGIYLELRFDNGPRGLASPHQQPAFRCRVRPSFHGRRRAHPVALPELAPPSSLATVTISGADLMELATGRAWASTALASVGVEHRGEQPVAGRGCSQPSSIGVVDDPDQHPLLTARRRGCGPGAVGLARSRPRGRARGSVWRRLVGADSP